MGRQQTASLHLSLQDAWSRWLLPGTEMSAHLFCSLLLPPFLKHPMQKPSSGNPSGPILTPFLFLTQRETAHWAWQELLYANHHQAPTLPAPGLGWEVGGLASQAGGFLPPNGRGWEGRRETLPELTLNVEDVGPNSKQQSPR